MKQADKIQSLQARGITKRFPGVLANDQIDFEVREGEIHALLGERRLNGATTLLISEDLDEILSLADRIAVMYEGELMGMVTRATATIRKLGMMMGGLVWSN